MRKIIKFFFVSLLILYFLNGCSSNNANEDIFQFKGSYIGDNNAISHMLSLLPSGENLEGFKLITKEEPYGIIINYKGIEAEEIEKKYRETAIYNATFIFVLVQNANWITFIFNDQEYKLTKEKLQRWYGKELSEFTSKEELSKLTQEYLEDVEKANQLFN